ncbi:MAG: FtsX-like permease family protein [Nocardioidaceae bacterium]
MRAAIRLGLRLTGAGVGPARLRSLAVASATTIGTVVLLALAGVTRAEQRTAYGAYDSGLGWLLVAVVLSVALPVLVLAATAGRLSAELRDRRLANLRLLGLSPGQTRVVAVTETGVVAALGTVAGLVLFLLVRPALSGVRLSRPGPAGGSADPWLIDYVVVLVTVTAMVVALAALPQRLDMKSVLAHARRAESRRPGSWRFAPIVVGLALCGYVVLHPGDSESGRVIAAFFCGVTLTGVGVLLVTPVLVHLVAGLLVRRRRPVLTIAGRRLQAQPAGVTRVVAALLIGLFLVTGGRSIVVAFESTPQYIQAERNLHDGQRVALNGTRAEAASLAARARQVEGVRRTVTVPHLVGGRGCAGSIDDVCLDAVVATCAQLHHMAPELTGCVEGRPMWLDNDRYAQQHAPAGDIDWFAPTQQGDQPTRPVASFPAPTRRIGGDAWNDLAPIQALAVVPPSYVRDLPMNTWTDVLVLGEPGRGLADRMGFAGGYATTDDADYDFVAGLRALVWGVAAVILAVGLLSFGIASVDRAVSRRREVVGLQLLGVSPSLLRRTQWVEAALPVMVGSLLAIGLGLACGAAYLSLAEDGVLAIPWTQSLTLGGVCVVGAAVIAGLTVIAASPRLRPGLIRAE